MSKPLYELTTQYRELSEIDDMDPQALADTLEALTGDIEEKAKNIAMVRSAMLGDVTAIDAEIARLSDRKKTIANRETSLREYLRTNMLAAGIKKITCPLFTITLVKGRDLVMVDDINSLPDDYVDVKTSITANKKALMDTLKTGESVEGARLVKSDDSIRFK